MSKTIKWEKDGKNWKATKLGAEDFVYVESLADGATWCVGMNGDCSDTHTPDLKRAKLTAVRWLLGCLKPQELA